MKIKSIIIPLNLIIVLSTVILISSSHAAGADGSVPAISFQEFLEDFDTGTGNFSTFDPGEIVDIEDKIIYIKYWEDEDTTEMWFESTGISSKRPQKLSFNSDITGNYVKGEIIRIEITIFLNENTGMEDYDYSIDDIDHVTIIDHQDDESGIDLFGYHLQLPDQFDNNFGRFSYYCLIWLIIGIVTVVFFDIITRIWNTKTKYDISLLGNLKVSILILIFLFGMATSLSALELSDDISSMISLIFNIGMFLTVIWLIYKVINIILIYLSHSFLGRKDIKIEKVLIPVIRKFIALVIFTFTALTLLGFLGIDLTVLALGGVVLSMVIAFAAQDTLSNYFSGIFLIAEPDFKEKDIVILDDTVYEVRNVGVRNTKLYDVKENMLVLVPNNMLANNKIVNLSEPDKNLKLYINIGVAYGTDPHKVKKILLDIASKHPNIIQGPGDFTPIVRFWEFGDSSLNFKLVIWIDDIDKRFDVRNDVNFEIDKRFKLDGIKIPFPQRDVHIQQK